MYVQSDVEYRRELAAAPDVAGRRRRRPPTEDVVGRVRESKEVLASLPHSGGAVLVGGDRRHGKTSLSRLVQRMAADQGAVVVSVSAERETYAEFVSALISELARLDPSWAKELAKIRLTLTAGPVRLERDSRAAATLDDLLDHAIRRARGRILALFIDEVSVLARNLERAEPGSGGDTFLHMLRRIRQENPGKVATVLSGSIGFHHVSADAPSTVNDIPKIAVGPIRSDHATYLAECLLLGSATPTTDLHAVGDRDRGGGRECALLHPASGGRGQEVVARHPGSGLPGADRPAGARCDRKPVRPPGIYATIGIGSPPTTTARMPTPSPGCSTSMPTRTGHWTWTRR